MGFSSVRTYQFRNLEDSEIIFSDKDIYLVGENGQGKTNFIESVYLLCVGSSFRTKNESFLLKNGCNEMSIAGNFNEDERKRKVILKIENKKKTIFIDGKRIKDRKELLRDFPCIAFTHDDINFVNGTPAARRQFINQTISMFDETYIDSLRTYNRVIKLRNRILKERKPGLLDVYDYQAAEAGMELQRKRTELMDEYNTVFTYLYRSISGTDLKLAVKYSPSWKIKSGNSTDDVIGLLYEFRNRDLMYGTSTSGPHRDRIGFYADGKNFAATASTGQIRLISLVLRASQAAYTAEKSEKKPVLLLDDVLLEMDLNKRKRFLEFLPEYRQAFFTFLPDEGLVNSRINGPLYHVNAGIITRKDINEKSC